jgi:hypothetical protein
MLSHHSVKLVLSLLRYGSNQVGEWPEPDNYGPEALKAIGQAFDEARLKI